MRLFTNKCTYIEICVVVALIVSQGIIFDHERGDLCSCESSTDHAAVLVGTQYSVSNTVAYMYSNTPGGPKVCL